MANSFDIVVASHLRWSFVWQRPQQLMSRLAQHRRILFVEEPIYTDSAVIEAPRLDQVQENISVLAPRVARPDGDGTPIWSDRQAIADQVRHALQTLRFDQKALWFYTPLPEFLLHVVDPDLVVYDVMDELANFRFAPPQLKEQEARLLRRADVVFTGGASLYEAKAPFNHNTHLFASGVDSKHYAKACLAETEVPEVVKSIPGPKATYIGVIDERLDYDIIRQMAEQRPNVQFLMCGPIVKVDPAQLPQAANIHYLGQQAYKDLPRILKGSDICLMPFALNEATKFISPTKTLEYMATHRPIVSTPIRDVERFYSDIVYLAEDTQEFIRQIDAALDEPASERAARRKREEKILAEHAWDAISDNMEALMQEAYNKKTRLVSTSASRVRIATTPMTSASSAATSPVSGQ
jgi:UDP-galactopyranose mutase